MTYRRSRSVPPHRIGRPRGCYPRAPSTKAVRRGGPTTFHQPNRDAQIKGRSYHLRRGSGYGLPAAAVAAGCAGAEVPDLRGSGGSECPLIRGAAASGGRSAPLRNRIGVPVGLYERENLAGAMTETVSELVARPSVHIASAAASTALEREGEAWPRRRSTGEVARRLGQPFRRMGSELPRIARSRSESLGRFTGS